MKHLFIVNPVAGGRDVTEEIRSRVQLAFQDRSDPYEIHVTSAPHDATAKIRQEAASGDELRVYACGGDGTFNECVCGAAELPNVAVCPFPTGTGNDFCRMFGSDADLFRRLDALTVKCIRSISSLATAVTVPTSVRSVSMPGSVRKFISTLRFPLSAARAVM